MKLEDLPWCAILREAWKVIIKTQFGSIPLILQISQDLILLR